MEELNVPDIPRRGRGFHNVNVNVNGRVVPRLYSSEELSTLYINLYNALVMIYDLTDHGNGYGQLWQDPQLLPIVNDTNKAIEYAHILGHFYSFGDIYDLLHNIDNIKTIRNWFVAEINRRERGGTVSSQGEGIDFYSLIN